MTCWRFLVGSIHQSSIGIVPLNWKYSAENMSTYLEGIAGYGFEGIQIGLDQGRDPKFLSEMKRLNLRIAEHYIAIRCTPDGPIDGHKDEYLEQIEFAREVGVEMLVFAVDGSADREKIAGRVSKKDSLTTTGLQQLAQLITELASKAASYGVASSFHPHAATYIETVEESEALMALVSADIMGVCLDVGHWIVGGGDPVAAVNSFGDRIAHVHVKDVSGEVLQKLIAGGYDTMEEAVVTDKLFVPAGTGLLNLDELFTALNAIEYSGWLMSEQDSAFEPSEQASEISMKNIKAALLKI